MFTEFHCLMFAGTKFHALAAPDGNIVRDVKEHLFNSLEICLKLVLFFSRFWSPFTSGTLSTRMWNLQISFLLKEDSKWLTLDWQQKYQ